MASLRRAAGQLLVVVVVWSVGAVLVVVWCTTFALVLILLVGRWWYHGKHSALASFLHPSCFLVLSCKGTS